MPIKKAFQEVHNFLVANEDKKVKTVMDQLVDMMSTKAGGGAATAVHRDDAGNVVAILDYYYKKWLPVEFVEFGAKKNSATGLNTMCKWGVSNWTKQQREFKKGKEDLLALVASGEVQPTEIQERLDELENDKNRIEPFPIPELAFDSIEEFEAADWSAMEAAAAAYEEEMATQQEADDE
jgi:hypothetical protein